jgi:hypothetical protein
LKEKMIGRKATARRKKITWRNCWKGGIADVKEIARSKGLAGRGDGKFCRLTGFERKKLKECCKMGNF